MEPEELLALSPSERYDFFRVSTEMVDTFFARHPSYGGTIHSGFSNLFGALELYKSDLIVIINHAILPVDGGMRCLPKNVLWETYVSTPAGDARELVYIRAHNADLNAILDTEIVKDLETRTRGREKAFSTGLVGAAYGVEASLKSGSSVSAAFECAALSGIKAFKDAHSLPVDAEHAWRFLDAAENNFLEAAADRIGQDELWALRAVQELSRLRGLIGHKAYAEVRDFACGDFPGPVDRAYRRLSQIASLVRSRLKK